MGYFFRITLSYLIKVIILVFLTYIWNYVHIVYKKAKKYSLQTYYLNVN